MQIGLFEIQNDVVVPDEVAVRILPWLRQIREKFPDEYLKVYAYLFYMSCWDGRNIYLNIVEEEREAVIVEQLGIDFSIDDPVITKAVECCKKLYETPAVALFKAMKVKIADVANSLNNTSITYGKNGNASQIDMFMKRAGEYADIYDKLDSRLKEEQSKVRGGREMPYDMLPDYKNLKE